MVFSNNHILDAIAYGMLLEWDSSFSEMNNNTIEKCGDHPIRMAANKVYTIGSGNIFNCPDGMGVNIDNGINYIKGSNTWKKLSKPYYVEEPLDVSDGVLIIEPGTIIKFRTGAKLRIGYWGANDNSTLIANGTIDNPITFTSAASNPTAGDWNGIEFQSNSFNNSMKYCTVQYAGNGTSSNRAAIGAYYTNFSISNSLISNSSGWGVYYNSSSIFTGSNNLFQLCALGGIGH